MDTVRNSINGKLFKIIPDVYRIVNKTQDPSIFKSDTIGISRSEYDSLSRIYTINIFDNIALAAIETWAAVITQYAIGKNNKISFQNDLQYIIRTGKNALPGAYIIRFIVSDETFVSDTIKIPFNVIF